MIDMRPVESSNIDKVGYDEEKRELHVLFKSGGHYVYSEVPKELHSSLMAADSIGGMLHKEVIKDKKFQFRKLEKGEVDESISTEAAKQD